MNYLTLLYVVLCSLAVCYGQPRFISQRSIRSTDANLAADLGLTDRGAAPGQSSTLKKIQTKGTVTKYMQLINSIPVYGTIITAHKDDLDVVRNVQGFVAQDLGLFNPTPLLDGDKATQTLRAEYGHIDSTVLNIRADEPELNIYQTEDGFGKLVYKTGYFIDHVDSIPASAINLIPGNVSLPAYIRGLIDARTGEVVTSWNDIQFQASARRRVWGIMGNRKTGASYQIMDVEKVDSVSCRYRDLSKRIEVYDYKSSREFVQGQTTDVFTCQDAPQWNKDSFSITGGYSPKNEAFINADRFIKMWNDVMGDEIEPFRTNTSVLRMNVHFADRFENAFFDGIGFYFGDGFNNMYPLMTLDILCHEIGHGVTSWKGGNMEYRLESGAMNEAYSDILGETCDIYFSQKTDFLIAEEIMKPNNVWGKAFRDMCNPQDINGALDHLSQYKLNIDVHYTSGIYNKAWCTLTRRWGYLKAFEVFTDANLMYWNPTSTMHCGACGVEAAAADRGYNKDDVTAAFKVVGVNCALCR